MKITFKNSEIEVVKIVIMYNEADKFIQFDKMIVSFIAYVSSTFCLYYDKVLSDELIINELKQYNPILKLYSGTLLFDNGTVMDKVLSNLFNKHLAC